MEGRSSVGLRQRHRVQAIGADAANGILLDVNTV